MYHINNLLYEVKRSAPKKTYVMWFDFRLVPVNHHCILNISTPILLLCPIPDRLFARNATPQRWCWRPSRPPPERPIRTTTTRNEEAAPKKRQPKRRRGKPSTSRRACCKQCWGSLNENNADGELEEERLQRGRANRSVLQRQRRRTGGAIRQPRLRLPRKVRRERRQQQSARTSLEKAARTRGGGRGGGAPQE